MSSAVAIQLADAVTAVINGSSLGITNAERWYVPIHSVTTDLVTLQVSVAPRALTAEFVARRADDFTYLVDIGLQQKLPNEATNNDLIKQFCDPLMLLMEQIIDLFRGKNLEGAPYAQCMAVENPFIYSPEHIDQERVFTSVATIHFKLVRPRT